MMVLFYLHLCFLLSYVGCYQVTNQLDFERDCNVQMMVADSSIIEVFAYPQANVIPETSSCVAKFQATPSDRKIRIYVDEFFLGPGACGHKMNIYDGDPFLTEPTWSLGCNSERGTYTSTTGMVILSFEKPSVDTSQKYKFNFKLTTDRAAPLTGSAAGSGGGGLTSGAIAGIAVGGVVGAVIIIAICIFLLWKFMRQAEEKKRYGAAEPPPVFVTSNPPLSNCGIAPGSSRRSFKTQSHVAFSDVSKKSETSSNSASKSKSSKSYDNHGYSHDGTSVASSNVAKNELGVNRGDTTRQSLNKKDSNQTDLVRNRNGRSSYRGDKNGGNINYPDVVDSARKSEKVNARLPSVEARSRPDSVKRSEKDSYKNRSNSMKRESHKDQVERDQERDKQRYEDKNKNQNSRQNNRNHRNKSESVFTDDSNVSSVSDKRNDKRYQQTDRYDDKRYRDDRRSNRRARDDRGYRDDRYDDQRHRNDRFDDRRHYDDRYDYRDNTTRDTRPKERSSSQRRTRNSQRRYSDSDDEFDGRRRRRDERGKQRSNSTSRLRSSHRDSPSDFDRNRDNYRDGRGRYESERDQGLRRQDSSRSQSGRHRSRSSYR